MCVGGWVIQGPLEMFCVYAYTYKYTQLAIALILPFPILLLLIQKALCFYGFNAPLNELFHYWD